MIIARHLLPTGLSTPLLRKGVKRLGVKSRVHRVVPRHRVRKSQTQIVASTSADSSSASLNHSSKEQQEKSYASLHDFCMTIPYGGVIIITGLFGCFAGYGNLAAVAAIAGFATCLSAYCSWRAWRLGKSHSRYTLASAGLATAVGSLSWRLIQSTKGKTAGNVMIALSSVIVLFLVYNLAAGGNPPKRHN
eukprot:g3298.t1